MPQHLTVRRKIIYSILPLVILVSGVEMGLRSIGVRKPARPSIVVRNVDIDIEFPFMRADRELMWSLVPGFRGEYWGRPVSINNLALRGPDLATRDEAGTQRVVFFGDSITFGYGVGDDDTYAHQLGELARGEGVESVNAGVTGYTTYQVLRWLKRLIPKIEADVAVFCIGWNDSTLRVTNDEGYARRVRLASAARWISDYSYLYRAAMGAYLRSFENERSQPRTTPRVSLSLYRKNLEAIVAACRDSGIRPVFIDLPRRRLDGEPMAPTDYSIALRETARDLDVIIIDTGDVGFDTTLDSNESFFIDSLHFSPKGHRYFAERIASSFAAEDLY